MAETGAEIGYGMLLKMLTSTGPDVWTTLGKVRDVVPPDGFAIDMIAATHNESPSVTEEVIPGIERTTSPTFEIEYNMNSATVQLIQSAKRLKKSFRCVHPTGKYLQFDGYFENFEPSAPTEEKQVATVTIKRSGPATPQAAVAPLNLVLPAISGERDEGDTLTAFIGVWANEPTSFTYQWKNAGVNLPGATSPTYVVQSSDAGDSITVEVAGINSAGSVAALSAPVVMEA